jgi:hypothetical protein
MLTRARAASKRRLDESDENNIHYDIEHRDIEHRDINDIGRDYINRVLETFSLSDSMPSNFDIKPNTKVNIELGFKIDVKDVEDCEDCEDCEDVEDFAGKDVDGKDVDGKDFIDLCKIEVDEAIYKRLLNDKERNLLCYEVLPRDV